MEAIYHDMQHLVASRKETMAEKELQRIYALAVQNLSPQQQAAYQTSCSNY